MTPAEIAALDDVVKTQGIRVADVVFIGPLMLWGGLALRDRYPLRGAVLAVLGLTTVYYNARNYQRVRRALQELP